VKENAMREFKTILCPTDFSDSSYHALEYGVRFARHSDGTIVLAHIIHVPAGDLLGRDAYTLNFKEAEKQVLERLEEVQATHLAGYPRYDLVAVLGDPAEEIIGLARSRQADLIISATHGRSGLSHLVMGSVAEKIIRHAPCPVFVVRAGVE
jgi:nucleotide-binding universal stress UspA family protein